MADQVRFDVSPCRDTYCRVCDAPQQQGTCERCTAIRDKTTAHQERVAAEEDIAEGVAIVTYLAEHGASSIGEMTAGGNIEPRSARRIASRLVRAGLLGTKQDYETAGVSIYWVERDNIIRASQ